MAEIMKVMDAAKSIMRHSGNMHQWGEGYPSEAVITADIERNGGFVVEDDGKVVGYFAFLPSPEPTYAKIYEGDWWKSRARLTPEGKAMLTPENFFILPPLKS